MEFGLGTPDKKGSPLFFKKEKRAGRRLLSAFLISLVGHIAFLGAMAFLSYKYPVQPKDVTYIQLAPLEKSAKKLQEKRVVETLLREKLLEAHPESFLGRQNQRVDRQTVSKRQSLLAQSSDMERKKSPRRSKNKQLDLKSLGLPLLSSRFKPRMDQPQWATPGTQEEEYIAGVPESDRTALNTREYLFYSYFQHIRERLDRAWVPLLKDRLARYYRSGRHLASDMDHITKVLVILNYRGEVIRVQMISESGTRDLDDAAIRAFNQAGPFPNPPKAMIDSNQQVIIPWEFILKT